MCHVSVLSHIITLSPPKWTLLLPSPADDEQQVDTEAVTLHLHSISVIFAFTNIVWLVREESGDSAVDRPEVSPVHGINKAGD